MPSKAANRRSAVGLTPRRVRAFLPPPPSGAGRVAVSKRTYQPHRKRRIRTHGFRARMKTASGRQVLSNRRRKGRRRLAVTIYQK